MHRSRNLWKARFFQPGDPFPPAAQQGPAHCKARNARITAGTANSQQVIGLGAAVKAHERLGDQRQLALVDRVPLLVGARAQLDRGLADGVDRLVGDQLGEVRGLDQVQGALRTTASGGASGKNGFRALTSLRAAGKDPPDFKNQGAPGAHNELVEAAEVQVIGDHAVGAGVKLRAQLQGVEARAKDHVCAGRASCSFIQITSASQQRFGLHRQRAWPIPTLQKPIRVQLTLMPSVGFWLCGSRWGVGVRG
jgi:hypothetical protein